MTRVQIQEAKAKLSAMLERAEHGETIIVTKHGKATAAIIGMTEYEQLKPHLFENTWQALCDDGPHLSDTQTEALFARDRTPIAPRVNFEDLE
jgi:prevent-host-death family protein